MTKPFTLEDLYNQLNDAVERYNKEHTYTLEEILTASDNKDLPDELKDIWFFGKDIDFDFFTKEDETMNESTNLLDAVQEQSLGSSFCVLPEDHVDAHVFTIFVEYRGSNRYAVKHVSSVLSVDGTWSHEPLPSSRTDEWLENHRFTKEVAEDLARKAATELTVNGTHASEVYEKWISEVTAKN